MFGFDGLRRRRCIDVNLGLGFRLRGRRRIHDRGVGLFFLGRRIVYRRFFSLTSRKECGTNQQADVFVHKYWACWVVDYLR